MIRLAVPADVPDIGRLHVKVWQVAYRGRMPDAFLDALEPARRAAMWSKAVVDPAKVVLVATGDTSILGFCLLVPSRDANASSGTGEIAAVYVEPACWRSGVGRGLIRGALDSARQRNFVELTLWALTDNAAARQFYEACGFETDGNAKTVQMPGFSLHEVRYRRSVAK